MKIGVSLDDRVGAVADTVAHAARVFEIVGIDYCCRRDRSLRDAATAAVLDADELLHLLNGAAFSADRINPMASADSAPLRDITRFIAGVYHRRARAALVQLTLLASETVSAHSSTTKQLWVLQDHIADLARELVPHMRREEQYLFPYINSLESEIGPDQTIVVPLFGTVEYPLQSIRHDHAEDLGVLAEIREVTGNFAPPQKSCDRTQNLFRLLQVFDSDLQDHIQLENDVLFPRAVEAERAAAKRK